MSDLLSLHELLTSNNVEELIELRHPSSDEVHLSLSAAELPQVVQTLHKTYQATFADLFGLQAGPQQPAEPLQVHLIFALDTQRRWVHLHVPLTNDRLTFPSLNDLLPATRWYEREIWEELGIVPEGHKQLRGLRLPPDWLPEVYPQRHEFSWSQPMQAGEPHHFQLEAAPAGVVDYPLGPVRSGVVESGHYLLRTVGEELVDMHLQLFYKHRGVEKRAQGMPLHFLPLIAERISGTSAFAHSLALCQALERVAGVEAPRRACFLRSLLAEIERLYNHLGYQADLCQATGLAVGQAQFEILKERLLRLNAILSGHRYLFGMNVPGGISRDLTAQGEEQIRVVIREIRSEFTMLQRLLLQSPSHLDRLEGTGILRPQDARAYGALGPIGRASGIDRDLRRDHPYAAYDEVEFDVPVLQEGDAFARARLRLEETIQTCEMLMELLDHLPAGPVRVPLPPLPAGASALGWAESTHGESLHWVLIGEDGTLQRYRVRPASFANWQAFPLSIPGHNILTDFPVIEQSYGLSFAGADC
jgi:Ni,Fe-hydrogenase III large subunit/NADH:ubiquinone oxidoreductase subunit C